LEENGEIKDEEEEYVVGSYFDLEVNEKIKKQTGVDSKSYRGILTETSRSLGVRYSYSEEDGSVVSSYYPTTQDYELTGYKVRHHPKRFEAVGETGADCELFMQFAFKNTTEQWVLIAAGEVDALSAYQMIAAHQKSKGYEPTPVVSATIGESGSHKQIQKQYEWLSRFSKIIICPDQDEAGKKAVDKIAKVLPKGKVFVMNLPMKDINEMLVAGKQRQFISCFLGASAYVPSGIVGSDQLLDKIKEAAVVPKIPLPPFMHRLQGLMAGGIPLGVTLCLGSASGQGKSTFVEEITHYMIFNSPHRVGVVSLESDCAQYGTKLLSRHIGKKIDLIDNDEYKVDFLNSDEIRQKSEELFKYPDGTPRFHLIEERDGSLESMKELIMQLVVSCDCRVIILDPLQDLLDAQPLDVQSGFMSWIKGMMKSHGVTFILVNHLRKSSGGSKANSTGADIHEEDFMGHSSIFKSSACNLLFVRNKEAENDFERNVTTMKMTKCRWTGRTSPAAGKYYYDNETHTLHDLEDYLIKNPQLQEF
jgi:archaellum biogenesis ATPase FlaH